MHFIHIHFLRKYAVIGNVKKNYENFTLNNKKLLLIFLFTLIFSKNFRRRQRPFQNLFILKLE